MSRRSFRAMGVDVVVGGAGAPMWADVCDLVLAWEQALTRFRADSELGRVNGSPREVVVVSPTLARAVRAALSAAAATDGLVDPTIGAALRAAGYDRDFAELPDDGPLLEAPERATWRSVTLVGRVLRRSPGIALDLNGVVKGLVVDEALGLLPPGSFVSAGGDLATNDDLVVSLPAAGAIRLSAGGLATTGTIGRRWVRGGVRQHHVIDPRTARPSRSRWDTVTVAASSCLAADVAAKAALLLSDDGPSWLDERGLPGRFLAGAAAVENDTWRLALADERAAA